MEIIKTIEIRRSTRKFTNQEVDKNIIENILKAAINAPSPKNNQPWKFIVITKEKKQELVKVMQNGIEDLKNSFEIVLKEKNFLATAEPSLKIMEEAPVIILVLNTENKQSGRQTPVRKYLEMANILSAGAAIENILLASLEYGLGSLCISDIYFVIDEISGWLNTDRQIIAAVALGYPAESPAPLKKKEMDSLVEWK